MAKLERLGGVQGILSKLQSEADVSRTLQGAFHILTRLLTTSNWIKSNQNCFFLDWNHGRSGRLKPTKNNVNNYYNY